MNADTKRHIDSARQVLVGVVPNPTSQIDQITNALVYKFMDDMDQAAIKAGGEPSFFVGHLERYAWTRLMDARMGNQERMNLYSEALLKFSEAKQLPELFRGIFKSAFLPYRSPETLGLFLKEIDYFDYSHPEELGNAYEYLLSIMSSQGDAGQFRTPRHIIDFIVDVVNPTKDDKVLDPACGTGGFLVSSYKHILEQHDGKDDPNKKEKPLTPDQRRALANNFEGYDIDPGMVRIAQVNMYLHQFKNPKIYQYDSLSNDDRWNDKFSVILANPPFMSPKGGIKPHSKFSIQSSRSEVLFVDYIMNHLQPKGRAGIIVPEGIIFQSGTAYKQLRKNLVEDGLFAVVSLPSGVFNPYAGVKTSILFFDNEIAKLSEDILFIRVENDGFDLGAQRRSIEINDLPRALDVITRHKKSFSDKKTFVTGGDVADGFAQLVKKSEVSKSGDYNLSGEKYRKDPNIVLHQLMDNLRQQMSALSPTIKSVQQEYSRLGKELTGSFEEIKKLTSSPVFSNFSESIRSSIESIQKAFGQNDIKKILEQINYLDGQRTQKWPLVELDSVCEINPKKSEVSSLSSEIEVSFLPMADLSENSAFFIPQQIRKIGDVLTGYTYFRNDDVLVAKVTPCFENGKAGIAKNLNNGIGFGSSELIVLRASEKILPELIYYFVTSKDFRELGKAQMTGTGGLQRIPADFVKKYKIPLPPIEVQKEIVEQIEVKQNAIDHAKAIIQNLERERRYFGHALRKLECVEWVELGELFEKVGDQINPQNSSGDVVYIGLENIESNSGNIVGEINTEIKSIRSIKNVFKESDILYGKLRPNLNKVWLSDRKGICSTDILVLRKKKEEMNPWLYTIILRSEEFNTEVLKGLKGAQLPRVSFDYLSKIKIPYLAEELQERYLSDLKNEEEVIKANKKLIEMMKQKISDVLSEI